MLEGAYFPSLAHVEMLRSLRADIARGARSLDAGKGRSVDIGDVIRRARGPICERVSSRSIGRRKLFGMSMKEN